MNTTARNILNSAAEAASSKTGAYQVPNSFNFIALPLIHAGLLGVQRAPLNGPDLWVYITAQGRAAL